MKADPRYTIGLEFCGYPEPRHVVRFCDEWVGQSKTEQGAEKIAETHDEKRKEYNKPINLAALTLTQKAFTFGDFKKWRTLFYGPND